MTDALLHAASACLPALARTLKDLEEAKADLASTRKELEDVKKVSNGGTARTAMDQLLEQQWQQLPARIILLRHGQGEHNVDPTILQEDNPNRKPDNLCELTSLGRSQARSAGERIRKLLGNRGVISVISRPLSARYRRCTRCSRSSATSRFDACTSTRGCESKSLFGNFQRDMAQLGKDANEVRRRDSSLGCWIRTAIY